MGFLVEWRSLSVSYFRLVELATEIQDDVEAIKPVLCEREVLRLSCALGLLPSVTPAEFEHGVLAPEEFDEEFTRLLRSKLVDQAVVDAPSGTTGVLGLFGKQVEVRRALKRLGRWSAGCESLLHTRDQGIYCIPRPSSRANGPAHTQETLVLFSWLHDGLFASSRLRETATYVLRFLTCMSSDLQCCLSECDVAEVRAAMSSLSSPSRSWKSPLSVSFRVEKKEDKNDCVRCERIDEIELPNLQDGRDMRLLKGSFPGFSVVTRSTRGKRVTTTTSTFPNGNKCAEWVVTQAKRFALKCDFTMVDDLPGLQMALLSESDYLSMEVMRKHHSEIDSRLGNIEEECREEVKGVVRTVISRMQLIAPKLFSMELLLGPLNAMTASVLRVFDTELVGNDGIWKAMPDTTKRTLMLPKRLRCHMKDLLALFNDGVCLDGLLEKIVTEDITGDIRVHRVGMLQGFYRCFSWKSSNPKTQEEAFRAKLAVSLIQMQDKWRKTMENALVRCQTGMAKQLIQQRRHAVKEKEREAFTARIQTAFNALLQRWGGDSSDDGVLSMHLQLSSRQGFPRVICNYAQEQWTTCMDHLHVFKLASSEDGANRAEKLGVCLMDSAYEMVRCFTLGRFSVLIVMTAAIETAIFRVSFAPNQAGQEQKQLLGKPLKQFGRRCTVCDYNADERMMAFVTDGMMLHLYRFSANHSALEITRAFDLSLQTSLSAIRHVTVTGNSAFAVDDQGTIQSINFRSKQVSRELRPSQLADVVWRSHLLDLSDGSILARFAVRTKAPGNGASEYTGSLEAFAGDDHRSIPVVSPADVFLSKEVVVERLGDKLFVLDAITGRIAIQSLALSLRSDSYQICNTSKRRRVSTRSPETNYNASGDNEHWLRVLYHVYEKFPAGGLLHIANDTSPSLRLRISTADRLSEEAARACSDFVGEMMQNLSKLNKLLGSLDLVRGIKFVDDKMADDADGWKTLAPMSLVAFIQNLVTFVPIQICRAEGNALRLMTNGRVGSDAHSQSSEDVRAVDIARSIRFGLLSPLLNAWNRPIFIITSMGKQSTGKSYFLNHLAGTSFAIAGTRCTDGAWMSVRILQPSNVLLVVLDFEGLGSFERTEQEDVLLSLLNASISMFTIFRVEMRFDKEMDELFARFQKAVTLLQSDPRLFRGMLFMSVKDVNPNDQQGVMDEFYEKLNRVVGPNKEHNFVSDLYTGHLEISCSPPLGTANYYNSLDHARMMIESELDAVKTATTGFVTGKAFLDCIRLVLAKISILDWTSLDDSAQRFVLAEVADKLPGLVRTGCLIPSECTASATGLSEIKEAIPGLDVSLEDVCAAFPVMTDKWKTAIPGTPFASVLDDDIDLEIDIQAVTEGRVSIVDRGIQGLLGMYMGRWNPSPSSDDGLVHVNRSVQESFDVFLSFFVRRRCLRIRMWASSKFGGRVPEEWNALDQQHLGRFMALFTRCQSQCGACRLGCMKSAMHSTVTGAEHNCGTGHHCQHRCRFCLMNGVSEDAVTPACAKEAGHSGSCECRDGDHTCGMKCCLSASPNCGQRCERRVDHEGEHLCGAPTHACGASCSLEECAGRCILDIQKTHSAHKCVETACIQRCVIPECGEHCSVMDHFHGQPAIARAFAAENNKDASLPVAGAEDEQAVHICAKAHACPHPCGDAGICRVDVFLKQSSKEFAGARSKFRYTYQEMNGSRKKCAVVLPPKQQSHVGEHSCTAASEESVADIDSQTEVPLDDCVSAAHRSKDATIHYCDVRCPCCSYYCSKAFGHAGAHSTSHGNMRNTFFVAGADDTDIDIAERKYKAGEVGEAEMCNLFCSEMGRGHVHYLRCEQNDRVKCVFSATDQRRHCFRALEPTPECEMDELLHDQFWRTLGWEDPCVSSAERELFRKCAFRCDAPEHDENPSFCVLPAWHSPVSHASTDAFSCVAGHQFECSHVAPGGRHHHVFVLDCSGSMSGQPWEDLAEAVHEYVANCVSSGATLDVVSIVTFSSSAVLAFEAESVVNLAVTNLKGLYRGGGTAYALGMKVANEVLSRIDYSVYQPVVVFFSDGLPFDVAQGEQLAEHLQLSYTKYGLQSFAVGFGRNVNLAVLERLAYMMGGEYRTALTGTEVKTAFHSISASIHSRAGLALSGTTAA